MPRKKLSLFQKIFGERNKGMPKFENPPPPPKKEKFALVEVKTINREGKIIKSYQVTDNGWGVRSFDEKEFENAERFYNAVVEHGYAVRKNVIKENIIKTNF